MNSRLIPVVIECLQQEIDLLARLSDAQYSADAPGPYRSSIGKHIRHNLDHFSAFFAGIVLGRIDYESRQRNELIERSTAHCADFIRSFLDQLSKLEIAACSVVHVRLEDGAPLEAATWVQSSIERELQFLLGHTVHHHAIIAMILGQHGIAGPEGFGVAPSTQRYELEHITPACA